MNRHKHIANAGHEEVTRYTTRTFSRHGVSAGLKREARLRNRAAKRIDARWHVASQDS
jgi:hypothetical protein